ncbi:MAG: hypothetical protein JSV42_06305 [Chloroflexota bacterium]|nr:MAG: hypothetical protein JSV42_06305 [Chloroflexota bacterium]
MGIRLFDWRDFPILLRYRHRGLFFDNASVLTRGEMLVPIGAMLSYFAHALGIYTFLYTDDDQDSEPILGQVTHGQGEEVAKLSFLAPETVLEADKTLDILDRMAQQIGNRGAFHLVAEVQERSAAFDKLRDSAFALYVHQRIWKCPQEVQVKTNPSQWRDIRSTDLIAVRSLYSTLVPALVQQVELLPAENLKGLVYYLEEELLAYADIRYGQRGIWVQPYIHPDARGVTDQLGDLLQNLPNRHSRPVYLCVRSYQSWLDNSLEDLQAQPGPLQAVMVKHLAIGKKVRNSFSLPALEGGQQEVTTPFMQSERYE